MFRFRAILLWLMMLAVPFQGYAASAMMFCATPTGAAQASVVPHEHAGHQQHAKAGHSHDGVSADPHAGHHTGHHADSVADTQHDEGGSLAQKCGTCASCHSVGLMPTLCVAAVHGLPQADLTEPPHAMATVSHRVPDKPPRA
jgi:hypothetical protein